VVERRSIGRYKGRGEGKGNRKKETDRWTKRYATGRDSDRQTNIDRVGEYRQTYRRLGRGKWREQGRERNTVNKRKQADR
jgi:hypothetical protein